MSGNNITTTRWFVREEIDLMRRCLEAVASAHFIVDDGELQTITGWCRNEYRDLLERFRKVVFEERALSQTDFAVLFQAVAVLQGTIVDRPRELEPLLGVSPLHRSWFVYKLFPIRNEWERYVQYDANGARCASTIP